MTVAVPVFPPRAADAHKGTVGRIVVVGGRFDDVGMVGAPAFAAIAAFRAGAGLVQILTTEEAHLPVSILAPGATTRATTFPDGRHVASLAESFAADVVAIGPGLTPEMTGADIVALMNALACGIVVDADGLNALASVGTWCAAREGQVVVTPHPGEMKRLTQGLGLDEPGTQPSRREIAMAVARRTRTVVVLKGAGTVVADGARVYVNDTGHSGMATAGAGDVLTGVIAALMGQKMAAFEAAVLGTYLHGRAGEIAGDRVGLISVTARDIIEALGSAISEHRSQKPPTSSG